MKNNKVPVAERALVARVNRKLKKDLECLRRCRPDSRWWNELGAYHLVDLNRNVVLEKHVNLEEFARKIRVLAPFEALEG